MTIDEAIFQYNTQTQILQKQADYSIWYNNAKRDECLECAASYKQLAEWLIELKETKALLRHALDDMNIASNDSQCKVCTKWHTEQCLERNNFDCYIENKFKWRYADEVKKILNK